MFKLLLLVVNLQGQPTMIVDVGLSYDNKIACEADASRATGMLERILEEKVGAGNLHVATHLCQQGA